MITAMLLPFLGAVSLAFIIYAMLAYGTTRLFGTAALVFPLHMTFVGVVIYSAVILLNVNPITVIQVIGFIMIYMTWRKVNLMGEIPRLADQIKSMKGDAK